MSEYKGQLEGFPKEVVEKMLERQVEQGNNWDFRVFEKERTWDKTHYGFNWEESVEGNSFWVDVISGKDFNRFFEKYPKKSNTYTGKEVEKSPPIDTPDIDTTTYRIIHGDPSEITLTLNALAKIYYICIESTVKLHTTGLMLVLKLTKKKHE